MSPAEFKAAWEADGGKLYCYSLNALASVPEASRQFLTAAGLPTEAAPCLSFGPMASHWMPPEIAASYLLLGSDGAGNPIVLDDQGAVLVLDHERSFAPQYLNRDVATLAATLLLYRTIIREAEVEAGPDAFDGEIPAHLREKLAAFLRERDPRALEDSSDWATAALVG